jgi:hypothetical protein
MFNWQKIGRAILVGVVVGFVCLFLGIVLPSMKVPPLTDIADFLKTYCWAFGVLAGLIYYFFGP